MSPGVVLRPEAEKGRREVPTPGGPPRPSVASQRLAGARAAIDGGDLRLAERLILAALRDLAAEDAGAA